MNQQIRNKYKELITYGYYPSGKGFNDLHINSTTDSWRNCLKDDEAIVAYNRTIATVDLDYIKRKIKNQLSRLKDAKGGITLLFSGGMDSTLLGILLNELDIKYNTLTLSYESYSEDQFAYDVGKNVLHLKDEDMKFVRITKENLKEDLFYILFAMPAPYEKGSVLLSYYLAKYSDKHIIAGDGADTIFAPSFEKKIATLDAGEYSNEYISKHDVDIIRPNKLWKYSDDDQIKNMMLFSVIHDQRYYYHAKYQYFIDRYLDQRIYLPYINRTLFEYTLSCKELHRHYRKYYLKEIMKEYTDFNFVKKALKVERADMLEVLDEYYDESLLRDIVQNSKITLNDFESRDKIKMLISLANAFNKLT